ncbi:MAG: hypothetical protein ACM3SU_07675 [Acidobacteriota bacterium]
MKARASRLGLSPAGAALPALAGAATAALWAVSRGKWSDALIDSGREWIVPDALSRGELLYRDVVYWFGPLTPYFHAALFAIFGSGFGTLVAAGVLASVACLGALYGTVVRVAGRREAVLWSALAIPALCFMPNAGGSLLGMGYRIWHAALFTLLAAGVAARRPAGAPRLLAAGALAGLAGLCRTEWGLAAAAAVLLASWRSSSDRRRFPGEAATAAAGFVGVFGATLAAFLAAAGPRAVLSDGHLLFGKLPQETRAFLVAFSGVADWRRGLLELLYSAAMWASAALAIEILALRGRHPNGRRGAALAGLLLLLAVAAVAGGAAGAVVWSAAPAVCAFALAAGLRRRPGPRGAALSALGLLGLLLSYRRPFHIGDSAYVGPPLLFAFVCAAGLLRLRVARFGRGSDRRRLSRAFATALVVAVGAAYAARLSHYAAWEGEPIAGTSRMLTARPEVAREIEALALAVRRGAAADGGLVVFPEGELLNFLSGQPNPIRHKLYLPGYLTEENEGEILRELDRARPAAVVLWRRPTSEYQRGLFGADYGRKIRAWIDANYEVAAFRAPGAPARANPRFLLGLRRGSAAAAAYNPAP